MAGKRKGEREVSETSGGQPEIPKWQLVENVVAICHELAVNVPGAKVIQRAQIEVHYAPGHDRDVDVLVEIPFGGEMVFVGVEVKAHKDKLDAPDMDSLIGLSQDVQLHHYVIVCSSGYTELAELKARRAGIELATIDEFRRSQLFATEPGSLVTIKTNHVAGVSLVYETDADFLKASEVAAEAGTKTDELMLEGEAGQTSVMQFAVDRAGAWAEENKDRIRPVQLYPVCLFVNPLEWRRASVKGREVPLPSAIEAIYTVLEQKAPDYRFRLKGMEFAAFFADIDGVRHQFALVGTPNEDGSWKPYVAVRPLRPKEVRVSVR